MAEQNYKNHARIVPIFHYGTFLPLLANFIVAGYRLWQGFSLDTTLGLLVALALIFGFFSLRGQVLTVQDRVIRLESGLRMQALLPADVAAKAAGLPVKQLVALRFAGDQEFAALVTDVLSGKLTEPKAIKEAIRHWRADHVRA